MLHGGGVSLWVENRFVELRLGGVLPFDRGALRLDQIEGMIEEQYQPLLCFVRDETRATEFAVGDDQQLSRPLWSGAYFPTFSRGTTASAPEAASGPSWRSP